MTQVKTYDVSNEDKPDDSGMIEFETMIGDYVKTEDYKKLEDLLSNTEPIDTYYPSSGIMKKTDSGVMGTNWVHINDHRAHLAALEIKYSREDENAIKGCKRPAPVEDKDPIAESHRYNFNSTMGPYLHPDDHGAWIPFSVHIAIAKNIEHRKDENFTRTLRANDKLREKDHREGNRRRYLFERENANRRLLIHDTYTVLERLAALEPSGDPERFPDSDEFETALQNLQSFVRGLFPDYEVEGEDDEE